MSSYTDLFRTFQEMDTEDDFIQYLERIVSGNATDSSSSSASSRSSGINRPLARLSHNADALYEALVSSRSTTVNFASSAAGDGTFLFDANKLTTSHNLHVKFVNPLGGAKYNVIAAGSSVALTNGQVLYVEIDRDNDAAVLTYQVAADWDAFIAAHSSTGLALDLFMVAYRAYNSLVLWDGTRIRQGSMISHEGTKSSAYAERVLEQQDVNTFLTVAASASANILTYSSGNVVTWPDVEIHLPGGGATVIKSTSGSLTLGSDGMAIYANVPRDDQGLVSSGSVAFSAGALNTIDVDQSAAGTDLFVFAVRRDTASASVLYLCNGRAVHAGDTLDLTEQAGVRSIEVDGDGVLMTGDVKVDNDDGGIKFSTANATSASPEIHANISIGSSHGAFGGFNKVEAVYMPMGGTGFISTTKINCPDLWRIRISAGWVVLNDKLYSTNDDTTLMIPWGEGSSAFHGISGPTGAYSDPDDRATKVEAWLATEVGVGTNTVPWVTLGVAAPSTGTTAGWRSPAGWPGGWNEHDTGVPVDGLWMDTWAYIYVYPPSGGGTTASFAVDNRPPQSNGTLSDLNPWVYDTTNRQWDRAGTTTVAKCIGTVFMDRVDALGANTVNDYWTTTKPRPFVRTGTVTKLLTPIPFDGFGNVSYDTLPGSPDSQNQYAYGQIEFAWEWAYKKESSGFPLPPCSGLGGGVGWHPLRFAPPTHPSGGMFGTQAAMEWDFFYWGPVAGMPGTNYGDSNLVVSAQVRADGFVEPVSYKAGGFDGFPDAWPALPYSGCDKGYPGATGAPATATSVNMTWNVYPTRSVGSSGSGGGTTTVRGAMEPSISVVTSAKNANSLSSQEYSDLTSTILVSSTFGLGGSTFQETRYHISSHEPDIERSVEPSGILRHRLNDGSALGGSPGNIDFVGTGHASHTAGASLPSFVHTGNMARSSRDTGSGEAARHLRYVPYEADNNGMINIDHYHTLLKNGVDEMVFTGFVSAAGADKATSLGEWQFKEDSSSAGDWFLEVYEAGSTVVTAGSNAYRLKSLSVVDTAGASEDHITRDGITFDASGNPLDPAHNGLQQAVVSIDVAVALSGIYLPWKKYPWTRTPSANPAIDAWLAAYNNDPREGGTINKWMYTALYPDNIPTTGSGTWGHPSGSHWCMTSNVKACSTWSSITARDVPIGASDMHRLLEADWPGQAPQPERCGSVGFTYQGISAIHSIFITSYEENFNSVAPVIYPACFPGKVLP